MSGPLRDAAVLVPAFRGADKELRIVCIVRAERGIHGGQIAFPGGKRDPGDDALRDTALREAHEEIGLDPADVTILSDLPVIETRTSKFRIHPFLARIAPQIWRPRADEVTEVLEIAVADLERPEAHGESLERFPSRPEPVRIEFYRVGSRRLWGATYRIVQPLLPRLRAGEWPI
jgi:8-oxo-dGTP pyrophosphatase MutT (NUDIX family)